MGWTPIDEPFALDRYLVVGEVAQGGMAEVLAAVQGGAEGVERLVAIKRILPHLAKDESFVDMMFDEARLVSRVRHPNVVQVHDYLVRHGQPHIVMEFLTGVPLTAVLRARHKLKHTIAPELAAYIAQQAALGLHAAHELRGEDGQPLDVVHRDISPQNLFLTLEGTVKVLDFGIAKAEHRKTRTEHGQLKGKLRYMSPEQLGSRAIDRRSDVYSLGIVLAEVLSGELFFRERNPEAALEERERPKDLPPMEPGLDRIVAKATASSVRERYGSAEDFALDLERYLVEKGCLGLERALANEVRLLAPESVSANQEIRAFSRTVVCPSPVHDATPGTSAGSTMQPGAPSTPGRRRRRRIVVGAALLLGSAMLGGALVTALHGDESDTPVRVVQLGGEPRPTEADLASGSRPIGTPPVVAPVTPVDSSEPEPPPPPADEMHGVRAPTTQEEGGSSETDDTPSTNEGRSPARMIRRSAMGASRMRRPREPRIDWAHGMFK